MLQLRLRQRPVLQVLCGAVMISFSGVFVKLAEVTPTASAFYRVMFGSLFLLAASLRFQAVNRPTSRELFLLVLCGLLFALDLFCWHTSIKLIGPGLATILGNFQVFFLAATGILWFKERYRFRLLAAIPLAVIGLLLIVGQTWDRLETDYQTGILFGLLTALCYSAYLLLLRASQSTRSAAPLSSLLLVSLCCSVFLGGQMLASGLSFAIPNLESLLALLGLGLFCQTIGWLSITDALPRIRASFTGLILLIQPALAFIWDVLLFGRPTSLVNWAGVLLTLTAIYLGLTGRSGDRRP